MVQNIRTKGLRGLWSICWAVGILAGDGPVEVAGQDVYFEDVTERAGVGFRHSNGASGRKYMVETVGSGACFFDYDGDGWPDLYVVNGCSLSESQADGWMTNRLYRNNGNGTFADVTSAVGVEGIKGYGMGCAAADYDNDGDQDLFVTYYGSGLLYRNEGDGTFVDVTDQAGVGGSGWQTGCAFGDYDNDGDLDLFVARYLVYSLTDGAKNYTPYTARGTQVVEEILSYPAPTNFPGAPGILYRNEGDGTFADVSQIAGISRLRGKGLGVLFSDFDGDGFADLVVANDMEPNFLFRNRGDGTFEEVGLAAGIAYDEAGTARAGMGVCADDYDGDGMFDLAISNFRYEGLSLYRNAGGGLFEDVAPQVRALSASLAFVGWGVVFLDYDNDGLRDLYVVNGHVLDNPEVFDPAAEYAQPNVLLQSGRDPVSGRVLFKDVSGESGAGLRLKKVSRGLATADYDRDGDVDLLVVNNNGRADLLRNNGGNRKRWLRVKLIGGARPVLSAQPRTAGTSPVRGSNRDGVGARVTVGAGGFRQVQEVRAGSGYLSCGDKQLHFGLGEAGRVDLIEVQWPGGVQTILRDLPADRQVLIEEDRGESP